MADTGGARLAPLPTPPSSHWPPPSLAKLLFLSSRKIPRGWDTGNMVYSSQPHQRSLMAAGCYSPFCMSRLKTLSREQGEKAKKIIFVESFLYFFTSLNPIHLERQSISTRFWLHCKPVWLDHSQLLGYQLDVLDEFRWQLDA